MNPNLKNFYVTKQNGERQAFDYGKLESSLRKTGTGEDFIAEVMIELEKQAFDGISTTEIYKRAYQILRKKHKPAAIRYSLKKAVGMLGPTGFPFEKFVAEIFKSQGYETLTDQIVAGKCVEHEIDVVAWKNSELIMVEAKFHNEFGIKSDLKVALYVKARWEDLANQKFKRIFTGDNNAVILFYIKLFCSEVFNIYYRFNETINIIIYAGFKCRTDYSGKKYRICS